MTEFSKGYLIGYLIGVACMIICATTHDLLENAEKKDATTATHQEEIIKDEEEIKKLKEIIRQQAKASGKTTSRFLIELALEEE